MKKFINSIKEGMWDVHLQDWVERRDGKKHNRECNYRLSIGPYGTNYEYYAYLGIIHLRAQSTFDINKLYELHILTASRKSPDNEYPIICLIINDEGFEELEEFDRWGNSHSGNYKLHLETLYLDPGDYIVTTSGTIGIYANDWYQFVSIDKDGTEHLKLYGNGIAYRIATEDEIKLLEEMLWVNNKRWNKEKLELEDL